MEKNLEQVRDVLDPGPYVPFAKQDMTKIAFFIGQWW